MKRKCACLLIGLLLLTGCTPRVYETVSDVPQYILSQPAQIQLQLPATAAVTTISDGSGNRIYLCEGYSVAVQTFSAGDLDGTIRSITGFSSDALTVLHTKSGDLDRYACAWSCAGEQQQIGQAVILSDGNYHYAVSVLADAQMSDTHWQKVLQSVQLNTAP